MSDKMSDRRKAPRHQILDTFSLFAVIQKKGACKLKVHNVSLQGISMDYEISGGEEISTLPLKVGETLDIDFYLNQTLSIPLKVRIVRVDAPSGAARSVGAEVIVSDSPGAHAFKSFVNVIDELGKLLGDRS